MTVINYRQKHEQSERKYKNKSVKLITNTQKIT
jgi:hypothetical protein